MEDTAPQTDKPESFKRLENFARAVFAVPKEEVDALEREEAKKQRKRTDCKKDKPAE